MRAVEEAVPPSETGTVDEGGEGIWKVRYELPWERKAIMVDGVRVVGIFVERASMVQLIGGYIFKVLAPLLYTAMNWLEVEGAGNMTPELEATGETIVYVLVNAVAVPCVVPADATGALEEKKIPDVSAIVPGATNVRGVDRVRLPFPTVVLICWVVPLIGGTVVSHCIAEVACKVTD